MTISTTTQNKKTPIHASKYHTIQINPQITTTEESSNSSHSKQPIHSTTDQNTHKLQQRQQKTQATQNTTHKNNNLQPGLRHRTNPTEDHAISIATQRDTAASHHMW